MTTLEFRNVSRVSPNSRSPKPLSGWFLRTQQLQQLLLLVGITEMESSDVVSVMTPREDAITTDY